MPDLFYLVSRWWKQMLTLVLLTVAVVALIVFIKKSEYLSAATGLPGSTYATDKASVFNDHTQLLYPALGTTEDLDIIIGTAQLDTVYIAVAKQFGLTAHYAVKEEGEEGLRKAALILKDKSKVIKSEYNELKVKVWNIDKTLAPQLANAIIEKVRDIHRDIQNTHNVTMIKGLQEGIVKLEASRDSIRTVAASSTEAAKAGLLSRITTIDAQVLQYQKLLNEYQLLADNKPEMLIIVERARVSDEPDRPKRALILAVTLVLSILFSLGLAILLEKRKSAKS